MVHLTRLGLLTACLLTSCALFAYGTGRLNPINARLESAFTVSAGDTNFVALTIPALQVTQVMPAPLSVYPAENLVKPFDRYTVSLRDARWQSGNAPSGWAWGLAGVTLRLHLWQRLGQVWEDRAEVYSDLEADSATLHINLSVPSNAPQGSYSLSGAVRLGVFSSIALQIGVTISNSGVTSGEISTRATGNLTVQPGGSYRLVIPVNGSEVQRLSDLSNLYLGSVNERLTDRASVRGDQWRVGGLTLPNRWQLEWLESNLSVNIIGEISKVGPDRLRTEYRLSYNDLRLLLGLRAIADAPGTYNVAGQLEYRAAPVKALRWAVTVKP